MRFDLQAKHILALVLLNYVEGLYSFILHVICVTGCLAYLFTLAWKFSIPSDIF